MHIYVKPQGFRMMMTVEFEAKDSLICTRACFDEPCTVVDDVRNLAGLHQFLKAACVSVRLFGYRKDNALAIGGLIGCNLGRLQN